jgi:hypothetical protein
LAARLGGNALMAKSHETINRLFRSHHRDLITRARRVIGSDDA